MKTLETILLERLKNNQCPHFCLLSVQGNIAGPEELLSKWTERFLQKYFAKKNYSHILNCADLLWISTENKKFKIEDFSPLELFHQTAPLEFDSKICIIDNYSKLTETILNKLLKILEEPLINLIIFVLNPHNEIVLPTIISRSVQLKINPQELDHSLAQQDFFEGNDTSNWESFYDIYKENKQNESKMIAELMKKISGAKQSFEMKQKTISLLKWLEESQKYNNSLDERALMLFQALKVLEGRPQV
jgi:hypothetical protein